jgi:Glycosyl transferase family 2
MWHVDGARMGPQCTDAVSCVVAIPVNNERERIVDCLEAISGQTGVARDSLGILLFLNNCTDGTREIVEAWLGSSPVAVRLVEEDSAEASAGWARRKAMDAAADWLAATSARDGVLLTTDADSRVPADWVARNLAAIAAGADAIAGRIVFDPLELASLSPGTKRRLDLEGRYEALLAEIEARLAPQRGNPWPCHSMKSGASIGVTLAAYRAVDGMPALASDEDRAFVDLLRSRGFAVRHAPDIAVITSGRIDGRARGGAADTLLGWNRDLDGPCDARLRRVGAFVLGVVSGRPARGRALHPRELPRQIARAELLLRWLRWRAGDRADRPRVASPTADASTSLSMP